MTSATLAMRLCRECRLATMLGTESQLRSLVEVDMRTGLTLLVLAALLSSEAFAQKFVVEIEGFGFSRGLTPSEEQQVEGWIRDVPQERRSAARTEEILGVLQQNAKELAHFKSSFLAELSVPQSSSVEQDELQAETHFVVERLNENLVEIDCDIAFGSVAGRLTHTSRRSSPVSVRLGERIWIAMGGGVTQDGQGKIIDQIHHVLTLSVREATAEDLKRKKVSATFSEKLLPKRNPLPVPGGKLSLRQ